VIRAVGEVHREVDHLEAQRPARHPFAHAAFDGGNVGLGHRAADNCVAEGKARSARLRHDLDHHVTILAMTAGLFLVPPADLHRFADRFLVTDGARIRRGLQAEAALQLLQCDAEMDLALAPQNHLMRATIVFKP